MKFVQREHADSILGDAQNLTIHNPGQPVLTGPMEAEMLD